MSEATVVRRWRRYPVNTPIRMIYVRDGERTSSFGSTCDISEGGVAVDTRVSLELGEQVHLEFALPYSEHVYRIPAMVRSRRRTGYSLEFLSISRAERQALTKECRLLQMMIQ